MNPFAHLSWLVVRDAGPILRLRAVRVQAALRQCEAASRIYEAIVDGPARIVVTYDDATFFAAWVMGETGEECVGVLDLDPHTAVPPDNGRVWGLHPETGRKLDRAAHQSALLTLSGMPHERIVGHLRDGSIFECVTMPDGPFARPYFAARYLYELRGMLVGAATPRVEA